MKKLNFNWLMATGLSLFSVQSFAQSALEQRVAELESKLMALEADAASQAFPELANGGLTPVYGLGAGASKVYHVPEGVSLGGYGEAIYTHRDGTDTTDFLRGIVYLGYKYTDNWVLNTEIEFEHGSTSKSGSASIEFATLDYLHSDLVNGRVGMVLVPVGLVNELHEPNTFLPVGRSQTESRIIPSTWRENGIGLFGENDNIRYKAYLVNGLKGANFAAKGVRGGRQKGSKAEAEDWAGVLRLDVLLDSESLIGGSVYHGGSGQALDEDVNTTIAEIHADLHFGAAQIRALAAVAELDDVAALNRIVSAAGAADGMAAADADIDSIGERMVGWYVEAGYDLFHGMEDKGEQALIPFVRYEEVNTQDEIAAGFNESGKYDLEIVTFGVQYRPLDELVFKADLVNTQTAAGSDEDSINLSFGYVF